MKKSLSLILLLFLVSSAAATSIQSENVTVDLETSEVEIDIQVAELTSSAFTYITGYPVQNVRVEMNGERVDCKTRSLQVGSEISCETDLRQNFNVHMEFTEASLISHRENVEMFNYDHSIYRPTDNYRLKVLLPPGTGVIEQENSSTPVVSPTDHNKGTDGRRIFVEWHEKPKIGDTLRFSIVYEKFSPTLNYIRIAALPVSALLVLGVSYIVWRRKTRDDIEEVYEDLSDDEIDLIELLRENEGEMLQKDVVDSSDYSKAKISGLVSGLVDKEIIEKKKDGRSNKLTISKSFSH